MIGNVLRYIGKSVGYVVTGMFFTFCSLAAAGSISDGAVDLSAFTGDIIPAADGTQDIGSASKGLAEVHLFSSPVRGKLAPNYVGTTTNHHLNFYVNGTNYASLRNSGSFVLGSPSSTQAAQLFNSSCVMWIDQANDELQVDCKYSDGTAKTFTGAFD